MALHQAGIQLTLATGKVLPSIAEIVKALNLNLPLILTNSALVLQANGTILCEGPIPSQDLLAILEFVAESQFDFALYTLDQVLVPPQT